MTSAQTSPGHITRAVRRAFMALACGALFLLPVATGAQTADALARLKIAPDLLTTTASSALPAVPWARLLNGELLVRALVVSNSDDTSLTALRRQVIALGGAVHYNYTSIRALAVMLPAARLVDLARLPEVTSISPNRVVTRTASLLQETTGAAAATPGRGELDGSGIGIGIAVLDSGIAWNHQSVSTSRFGLKLASRVRTSLDFVALGKGLTDLGWVRGSDRAAENLLALEATKLTPALSLLQNPRLITADPYGHGTHVASIAAGSAAYQWPDTSGVAPDASLYDIRVLDENGIGNLADVIAGIDWVVRNAKLLNIRVLNLSLAASSAESFLTDPLARAARSAAATGIVVVVAAGNAGKTADGREVYGAVGSPGHDPSVITVGAANPRNTVTRFDDSVTGFSSRGPTRGRTTLNGQPWVDNLLKPDLVAPGNRIVGALSADMLGFRNSWNRLVTAHPQLAAVPGAAQAPNQTLMELSGTSVAAPVVSGTVALMLQANPGLTPPLVKAILQYTAQPLPQANLLQQGTGLLNVEGAVRLATALRTDIGPAIAAGTLQPGDSLLARGRALPLAQTTINGQTSAGAVWSPPVAATCSPATRCSRSTSRSTTRP
jgi:serine protease AprX